MEAIDLCEAAGGRADVVAGEASESEDDSVVDKSPEHQ
jgi:hypothetical protein